MGNLKGKLYKGQMKEKAMTLANKTVQLELDMLSIQINQADYDAVKKHIFQMRKQLDELEQTINELSE